MIYVMSDIHGNMRRFNSIMEQINLLKSGEFDDKLIKSSLNRMKLFQEMTLSE